jgi:hypothetical protein
MSSTDTQNLPLNFLPGFHRESTQYSEEGKWYDGNRVRFREGKPENLRGYEQFSDVVLLGTARDTITWRDNNSRPYIGIGTNVRLYVVQNETFYDVTPISSIVSVSGNLETFSGSTYVKVSITNHTVSTSDYIEFKGVDTVGDIDINNTDASPSWIVVSVSGLNTFYVDVLQTATSSGSGLGTTGSINILLNTESTDAIQGLGYGAGVYNAGVSVSGARGWNDPATESLITFLPNMWTLDNWGEDLMALRRGSNLCFLDISASLTPVRSTIVTASPTATTFLVSPNDRHVICYGAREFAVSVGGGQNPMLVRWSDQEDYTNWSPSLLTTSGEVILAEGTKIIGAARSRNAINIWTDRAMYTQTFVGPPFIFNFTQVGSNCGLIGPHAAIDYDGVSFWMGDNNFFAFDGRVNTLPCTIRRQLFGNFNNTNREKVYAGINSEFKEIIWLYPSADSPEPDSYVIYNVEERTWVYGKLFADGIVTTFNDRNIYSNTITTGYTSATGDMLVWNNEPTDIYTGAGQPLTSYLESAFMDMDQGKQMMFVDRIIPDYTFSTGESVDISLRIKDYPNGTERTKGPYTINANTRKIDLRSRGRQISVRISATNEGSWRWGSVRMAVQSDGDR